MKTEAAYGDHATHRYWEFLYARREIEPVHCFSGNPTLTGLKNDKCGNSRGLPSLPPQTFHVCQPDLFSPLDQKSTHTRIHRVFLECWSAHLGC